MGEDLESGGLAAAEEVRRREERRRVERSLREEDMVAGLVNLIGNEGLMDQELIWSLNQTHQNCEE